MHIATPLALLAALYLACTSTVLADTRPHFQHERSFAHTRLGRDHALPDCQPFHADFTDPNTRQEAFNTQLTLVDGSYAFTDKGLEMYMQKPEGKTTKMANGTNDKLGRGTTVNATVAFAVGRVTFEISSPLVDGLVVAGILIGSDSFDEIDIEFVCEKYQTWETNIFVEPPNSPPEYNLHFSSNETVDNISNIHSYTIDLDANRIQWSLDGVVARTLKREDCMRNGFSHYPTHRLRPQFGIWDASGPNPGTTKWAGGPVDWDAVKENSVAAVLKSVTVEC
ncbi:Glycoside hydrolase family 16 protein [Mycena chlorophos]|uniref:Glycoside hydrolase family 16 protein n=1 Tax=Mycena chlorophos TaxID=658473 RepID=A0A8H6T167_MYCCL|nr:Glycoside hydrolase family 16 protein [Mycena chlorophos]